MKSLKQKESGIAPLAKRVLKSVFTIQTESGLGSGFMAWRDSTGTYIVTANHVVEGQLGTGVQISRKGGGRFRTARSRAPTRSTTSP